MQWNYWAAFGLILVAAFLRFKEYTCLARRSALAREDRSRECPSRDVADVILPIGALPEIDASLTNLDGRV
ncbi:hypothetical protein VDG82_14460, partial [Xanthomonas campestris pv. raphani]|nr:hypothetical protein [Xanthomonas campestris pv. raphani]